MTERQQLDNTLIITDWFHSGGTSPFVLSANSIKSVSGFGNHAASATRSGQTFVSFSPPNFCFSSFNVTQIG